MLTAWMPAVFVWTLSDVLGLGLLAIVVVLAGGAWLLDRISKWRQKRKQ